jgi:3-methyladenine DNA glycosylase AlkC
MAEAFKLLIHPELVRATGQHLARVWPDFERAGFEAQALAGLDTLALKARVGQLAQALKQHLPADAEQALGILVAALGPAAVDERLSELRISAQGLAGWVVWPMSEAVALIAIDQPELGLAALHAMTQRLSAEFAIRHFIVRHPALCFATLARWTEDPSLHVRRLVSEGSRPRLPWGQRLQALVQDPAPTLALLRALQDDPSAYVRRSVANHLNDIAKDHPGRVVDWLAEHLPGAHAQRRALLRHASRSLVKAGDAAVLTAWGQGQAFNGQVELALSPLALRVGDSLSLSLQLHSGAQQAQHLVLDYAVHHAKAAGHTTAKVFKGWVLDLAPGETRTLTKRHSFKPVTVRRYHPGAHALDLRINGQVLARVDFELLQQQAQPAQRAQPDTR